MQEINFQPQVENIEQFQRRKQIKRRKQKQIDQILAFNTKSSKTSGEAQKPDEFDSSAWENLEENKGVNMFQQQGKQLLSNDPSFKKLNTKYLFADQLCNCVIVCLVYFVGYPFWFCLFNIAMVIGSTIHLSCHLKSKSLTEFNKNHKRHRSRLNKIYGWIITLSMVTCTLFLIRSIAITLTDEYKFALIGMSVAYIGILYFQLKLFSNLRYIILLQKELSKEIPEISDYAQSVQFS